MRLKRLLDVLPQSKVFGPVNREIIGISCDSREVIPGSVFVCVTGYRDDGHRYAKEAVRRGAACIVVEKGVDVPAEDVTVVCVPDSRSALAALSAEFYGHPSRLLKVIGVTGTNGKTTITFLLDSILSTAGCETGLLGTIEYRLGRSKLAAGRTTPDSAYLQAMLAGMVARGVDYVTMEVSSHALTLHRVDCIDFRAGVLSNIAHDHLDFHRDFVSYFRAKAKLFELLERASGAYAVINQDDALSMEVLPRINVPAILYGFGDSGDVRAVNIKLSTYGSRFVLKSPLGMVPVILNLPGEFNIYNALAASAVAVMEGIPLKAIAAGIAAVTGIPGRYEIIDCGQDFTVIVDFAHNADALRKILSLSVPGKDRAGRKIVVFGCEGEKDRLKRPLMGEIAGMMADLCIITSDNLYNEDVETVLHEVEAGLKLAGKRSGQYWSIPDRKRAIEKALELAKTGDLVIIAGKGHETYQVIGKQRIPFDDRIIVKQLLIGRNTRL